MSTTSFLTARVPDELREQLEALARAGERSISGELRLALREHVERHDATPDQEGTRS